MPILTTLVAYLVSGLGIASQLQFIRILGFVMDSPLLLSPVYSNLRSFQVDTDDRQNAAVPPALDEVI